MKGGRSCATGIHLIKDSVAATEDYLDNYFEKNLAAERLLSSTVRTCLAAGSDDVLFRH